MLWLPPIWLCLFLMLVGVGLVVVRGLAYLGGPSFRAPLSTFQVFWFGYAGILALLQLYSVLLPMRLPALLAAVAISVAGFYRARGAVLARLRTMGARPRLLAATAIAASATALLTAASAVAAVSWYDTHLYHLQVVKWARAYPAVPGIANLHYRLAFNNSVHIFAALTDVFWRGRATHLALGFLTCVLIVQLGLSALQTGSARARTGAAFSLLVLPFVLAKLATNEIASLSSDLALALICIALSLELIRLRARAPLSDPVLALVLALAATAMTTKLAGAGMLAIAGLLMLRRRLQPGWSARRMAAVAALPTLILLGYFVRQVILSGWLLFPAPLGNLHLDWSLPEEQTVEQFRWIQSWARLPKLQPADVLDQGFLRWFEPWFERFRLSAELVALEMAAIVAWLRLARPPAPGAPPRYGAPAVAAACINLLIWFRGAPDLRFGAVFFWILLAALSAPLLGAALKQRAGMLLGLSLCSAFSLWMGGFELSLPDLTRSTSIPRVKAHTAIQKLEISPGLSVYVPENVGREDRCSDEPLPCTPYPAQQRLRRDGDLCSGFLY